MALDEPEKAEEKQEATPEKKKQDKHHDKKEKEAPDSEPTTGKGTKRKGLYDASPVVEGKRERKQVNRLELVVPVKSPEPTVKPVRHCLVPPRGALLQRNYFRILPYVSPTFFTHFACRARA